MVNYPMRALLAIYFFIASTLAWANDDILRAMAKTQQADFLPVEEAYQANLTNADKLLIEFDIAQGYYLYKHRFSLNSSTGQPITYSVAPGQAKFDEFFGDVEVYYDYIAIEIEKSTLGNSPIQINTTYQGCADAGLCYPPETVSAVWNPTQNSFEFGEIKTTTPITQQDTMTWFLAILLALAGGAFLNLMPCVFPVLSLKALSLIKHKDKRPHIHGIAYTSGIVISFVSIAAIMLGLKSAGQGMGWGFQLQSPVFVAILSYIFVILALNMSGLFEFNIGFSGAGQSLTEGHGYGSSFATGVLAALVASPCTAPFMGTALAFAITQPTAIALTIFASLGLGLGLPFLILTAMPSLIQKLPAPGHWMQSLREFLAFPLYITVVWLVWIISNQSGNNAAALVLIGGILIAMGIWAWDTHILKRLFAIALFATAASIIFNPIIQTKNSSNEQTPFSQNTINDALANGHPVFVNITADWCITCLVNEKNTLSSEEINTLFEQKQIIYIKGDWTNPSENINQYLANFNRNGVPLYVAYYNGNVKVLPQILTNNTIKQAFSE